MNARDSVPKGLKMWLNPRFTTLCDQEDELFLVFLSTHESTLCIIHLPLSFPYPTLRHHAKC